MLKLVEDNLAVLSYSEIRVERLSQFPRTSSSCGRSRSKLDRIYLEPVDKHPKFIRSSLSL